MNQGSRYERQILIDGWGPEGQERLTGARVGVAGAGGLGSPALLYLAAAGVGAINLCDDGAIELSNLNRQVLYRTGDIGRMKAEIAAHRLADLNPDITVVPSTRRVTDDTVDDVYAGCDLIVDCLDNFPTRFVLNRFCVRRRIPLVHAGVREHFGQVMLLTPPSSACLACLLPDGAAGDEPAAGDTDATADAAATGDTGPLPIVGATAGVVGSMEASLAIRWLLGDAEDVAGTWFSLDLTSLQIHEVRVSKQPDCPVCGGRADAKSGEAP